MWHTWKKKRIEKRKNLLAICKVRLQELWREDDDEEEAGGRLEVTRLTGGRLRPFLHLLPLSVKAIYVLIG